MGMTMGMKISPPESQRLRIVIDFSWSGMIGTKIQDTDY